MCINKLLESLDVAWQFSVIAFGLARQTQRDCSGAADIALAETGLTSAVSDQLSMFYADRIMDSQQRCEAVPEELAESDP